MSHHEKKLSNLQAMLRYSSPVVQSGSASDYSGDVEGEALATFGGQQTAAAD